MNKDQDGQGTTKGVSPEDQVSTKAKRKATQNAAARARAHGARGVGHKSTPQRNNRRNVGQKRFDSRPVATLETLFQALGQRFIEIANEQLWDQATRKAMIAELRSMLGMPMPTGITYDPKELGYLRKELLRDAFFKTSRLFATRSIIELNLPGHDTGWFRARLHAVQNKRAQTKQPVVQTA